MPKMDNIDDLSQFKTATQYTFSGVNVEGFEGATEQTLVTIIQDKSGSVNGFKDEMTNCLKTILEACKKDSRSENQMIRLVTFNRDLHEVHGFRFLSDVDPTEYDNVITPGGATALFDSTHTAIEASHTYGESLVDQGVDVNSIVFVITDGEDNMSKYSAKQVKEILDKARKSEKVESIMVILIGITDGDPGVQNALDHFQKEAGLDAYIDVGNATTNSLAKLAKFVSQSISSQSQSLNSGGPSAVLSF